MAPRIDLTGQKFGRLTVVGFSHTGKKGKSFWNCLCLCGGEKIISGDGLKRGTKSCGCLHREITRDANFIDITGQTFNKLTVLGFSHFDNGRRAHWLVECQCGNRKTVEGHHLRKGITKSCNCLSIEKSKARVGENHQNYNSEITDEERTDRRLYTEYKEWRTAVYIRDDRICQCCGKHGGKLNAHHIYNYRKHRNLRTYINNGITLCEECHKHFHHIYGKSNNNIEQISEFLNIDKNYWKKGNNYEEMLDYFRRGIENRWPQNSKQPQKVCS